MLYKHSFCGYLQEYSEDELKQDDMMCKKCRHWYPVEQFTKVN